MRNLEGKYLINKVATLPHSEIKPKIEKKYVSAYANYLKSTIQMQSHLSALGLLIIQSHGCYGE